MKSKLLIIGLAAIAISANGQVVDTSATGVDVFFSTDSDTLYSEFETFAGLKVTGDDLGHVLINAPGKTLKTIESGVIRNTTINSVVLELTEDMKVNLQDGEGGVGIPEIRGGLKLGYGTEILNNSSTAYPHFIDGEQYRYVEEFTTKRSTIFAPTLKNAERDSLRFGDADDKLSAIHFWDNTTVSFVTGYSTRAGWTETTGDGSSTGTDGDFTSYDGGTKGYTHTEKDGSDTYISETFLPHMVDSGRAVVVYYGKLDESTTSATTRDSIYSDDGFHDGDITLDITNKHTGDGFFRHWHMIGNPYKSSLKLADYMSEPLDGANENETNGYYSGRTISLLTDIDNTTPGFQPGYAAISGGGVIVGVNNETGADASNVTIPTLTELAPGQGFFVFHTAVTNKKVTTKFTNAMRGSSDQTLMKSAEMTDPFAFVNVQQVGNYSKGVKAQKWNQLAFTITDDVDPKEYNTPVMKQDLSVNAEVLLSTRDINIYTQDKHSDEYGFALKAVETSMVNKLIPVGFEAKEGNSKFEFSLSTRTVNMEDYDVFIVDRLLNTTHNISKKGPYSANIFKPGKQQDRFFLKFGHSEEEGFEEVVEIYSNGNFINVVSNSQNTEIEEFGLYDVLGKEVVRLTPKTFQSYQFDIRNLPRGVYFVKVTANGKAYNSKVLNNNN